MSAASLSPRIVGRYALYGEIASGGMATIYLGRLLGQVGFSRTVAIKCLHPQFAKDPDFMSMFLDEARLAARIQHPNAVQTLDVLATDTDLFLVMEYLQGESLSRLVKASVAKRQAIPVEIVASIICGMLHGLHAVHEARDEHGAPLGIVHRDVSPQNILVGVDGVARVLDFGVAKAAGRIQTTREGQLKGKLSYMAPEQVRGGQPITRQTDIYSATLVLWEALTGHRLREGENEAQVLRHALEGVVPPPSQFVPNLPATIDHLVARGAHFDPRSRFSSAREMALSLEACVRPATATEVGAWVEHLAHQKLERRAQQVAELESSSAVKVSQHAAAGYPGTNPNYNAPYSPSASVSGQYSHPSLPAPSSISQVSQPSHPSQVSQPSHPSQVSHPSQLSQPSFASQSHSQASIASFPQPPQPQQSRLGWIMVLLGISTAALVVASFCAILLMRNSAARASHAAAPAASAPLVSTTATTPPPAASAAPPAQTQDPFAEAVRTTATSTPPTIAASALPLATAEPTAHASKPRSTGAPKPDCDPPYTRDATGAKIYKVECFK